MNKLVEQFGLSEYTTTQFKNEIDVIPVQKNGNISIFKQALSNLLSNINKYAIDPSKNLSENQVLLTFDHGKMLGDIHVQVQDSGEAVISESILKNPAKKTDKGHGVGLYQLKRHLEQLGGDIHIEKSKKGAHFSFFMPLLIENSDELFIARRRSIKKAEFDKMSILIIDDSPDIHQILGLYLEEISPNITIHSPEI